MSGIICDNEGKMMKINKDVLKSLNPCDNRYKHFLEHHGEFSGSLNDFLDLPNLEYVDKIWIARRVLTKNQAVKWATLCAESVVHMFEAKYPDDKRLSDCINYLKSINDFDRLINCQPLEIKKHKIATSAATDAAHAAASATLFSTNATAHAANYAATSAHAAAHSATFASTSFQAVIYAAHAAQAAIYASYATHAVCDSNKIAALENQEALNLQFLKQVIN